MERIFIERVRLVPKYGFQNVVLQNIPCMGTIKNHSLVFQTIIPYHSQFKGLIQNIYIMLR